MNFTTRTLDMEQRFCEAVTMETITRVVPAATIDAVVDAIGVRESRVRKLPARLTILVLIGLGLYNDLSIPAVMQKLVKGVRLLWADWEYPSASASAFSQRRYQLVGVRVLALLFRQVCQPLAQTHTRGAFLFGLRLMALDGTKDDVPDTPANARVFGRHQGPNGGSAYPKVLTVLLSECGTHAVVDADFAPCYGSERDLGRRLLRSIRAGMLLMFDRGFYNFDLILGAGQRGASVLGRLAAGVRPKPIQPLPDGSYLAAIFPREVRRRKQECVRVRVIEYTFTDPQRPGYKQLHRLFTTLLDPQLYPALDLVCAYHERWEVELVIDELQVHQRLANQPLRSLKPRGVIQELYALLIAHYIVRAFMHQAALQADLDPDRLSFVGAVRIVQDALIEFQMADPACHPALVIRLLHDLARQRLPKRRDRINPRVVKRTISRFKRKRPKHTHLPQPTCTFRAAVLLI
jgi:hypothetical protein